MTQILYRPHHSARNITDLLPPGDTDWTHTNPNPMETAGDSSNFGKALSSYNEYLVVGEPNNGVDGDFGSFTLYSTPDNGVTWSKIAKIFPPVGYSDGVKDFGAAVSIYGEYILIGSPGDTVASLANAGSVYAYTFNPSTKAITFQERIYQNVTVLESRFGRELDHHGNNAVIACDNGEPATSPKRAFAYRTIDNGHSWQMQTILLPADYEPEIVVNSPTGNEGEDIYWTLSLPGNMAASDDITVSYTLRDVTTTHGFNSVAGILCADASGNNAIGQLDKSAVGGGRAIFDTGFPKYYSTGIAKKNTAVFFDTEAECQSYMNTTAAPSMQDIFNRWPRTDGNNYYESKDVAAGEALDWYYDSATDAFIQPKNTANANLILSPTTYSNFVLEATLSSANSDNDAIGLVMAFVREADTNYALIAVRTQSGLTPAQGYGIVLYSGTTITAITTKAVGTSANTWTGNQSRLRVERTGDVFTVRVSDWNVPGTWAYTETLDLNSNANLTRFKGAKQFGFHTHSQGLSTYLNITMPLSSYWVFCTANDHAWEAAGGSWIDKGTNNTVEYNLHNYTGKFGINVLNWLARTKVGGNVLLICDAAAAEAYTLNKFSAGFTDIIQTSGRTPILKSRDTFGSVPMDFTFDEINAADVVIVLASSSIAEQKLTADTVNRIRNYVNAGGGLFVITDHNVFTSMANQIAAEFNASFTGSVDHGAQMSVAAAIAAYGTHPVWANIETGYIAGTGSESIFNINAATLGDYLADRATGTVVIPAGQMSAIVPITAVSDGVVEGPETLQLVIDHVSLGTITTGTGTMTITDSGSVPLPTYTTAPSLFILAYNFGYELAIWEDWIAVGAYGEASATGVLYIYRTFDAGASWKLTQKINAPVQAVNSYFSFALAMNEELLAVGAPGASNGVGSVHVYGQEGTEPNILWTLRSTIRPPAGNVTEFATTVTLQYGVLLVGAPGTQNTNSTGAVYLYLDDDEGQIGTYIETPITIPAPDGVDTDFGSIISINDGSITIGGGGTVYTYPAPISNPVLPRFPRDYIPVESDPVVVSTFGYPTPVPVPQMDPIHSVHRDYIVAPSPGGESIIVHHGGGGGTRTITTPPRTVVRNVTVYHSPGSGAVYVGGGSPSTNEVVIYRAPSPTVDYAPPIVVKPPVTSVQGVPVFNFGIELVLDGNTLTIMDGNGNVFTYTTGDDGYTWDYKGALNIPGVSGASEMVRFGDTLVVTQPDASRYGVAGSGMMQIYVTFDGGKNWVLTTVNYPSDATLDFGRTFKEDHNLLAVSARRLRTDGTYEGVIYVYALNRSTLIWNQISVIVDPIASEHLESFGSVLDFKNNTITVTVAERAVSFGTSTVYVYQTTDNGHTWSLMRTLEAPQGTIYADITDGGLLIGGDAGVQGQPDVSITLLPANSGVTSIYLNEAYVPDAANFSTPIKVLLGGATSGYVLIEYATIAASITVPGGTGDIFSITDQNGNLLESIPLSLRYESYGYGCVIVPINSGTGFLTITPTSSTYWRATCFSPARWACPWLSSPILGSHANEVNAVLQDSMSPSCALRISPQALGNVATTQTVLTDSAFNVTKTYPYTYTFTLTDTTAVVFSVKQTQQYPAAGSLSMFASNGTTQLATTYWGGNGVYALATTLAAGTYKFKAIATNTIGGGGSAASLLTFRKTFSTSQSAVATTSMWYAIAMLRTKSGSVTFTGLCDKLCNVSLYASDSNTPIDVPGTFTPALQSKTVVLAPNTTYFVVALMTTVVGQATYLSLKAVDSGATILVTSRDWRVASFSSTSFAAAGVTPVERTAFIFETPAECAAYMQHYDSTPGALLLSRSNMFLYTGAVGGWTSTGVITIENSAFEPLSTYTNPITGNRYYVGTDSIQFLGTTPVPYSPEIASATVAAMALSNATRYNTEIGRNPEGANLAAVAAPRATVYNTEIGRNEGGTNLAATTVSYATKYNTEIGRNETGANLVSMAAGLKAAYTYVPPVVPVGCTVGTSSSTIPLASAYYWEGACTTGIGLAFVRRSYNTFAHYNCATDIWSIKTLPSASWYNIEYGEGLFIAVGAGKIALSSNYGDSWTAKALSTSTHIWNGIAYGDDKFVLTSTNSTNKSWVTADGITGTFSTVPASGYWNSVAFGNGTFVAINTNSAMAATSPDGITWTKRTLPETSGWYSVAFGNGIFITVAAGAYPGMCAISEDNGVTWTKHLLNLGMFTPKTVCFSDGRFFTTSYSNSATIASSTDGITWILHNLNAPSAQYYALAAGHGKIIGLSYNSPAAGFIAPLL